MIINLETLLKMIVDLSLFGWVKVHKCSRFLCVCPILLMNLLFGLKIFLTFTIVAFHDHPVKKSHNKVRNSDTCGCLTGILMSIVHAVTFSNSRSMAELQK